MNSLKIIFASLIAAGLLVLGAHWAQSASKLGSSINGPLYSSATNTSVSCGATTTALLAAGSGRVFFSASNVSTTRTVYICKGSSCTASTGIGINGVGTFYQRSDDAYVGSYSCVADATTTVPISYKQ